MIKKIISILFVAIMVAMPLFTFFPQQTQANSTYVPWYNSSWLYRKSFNVIGSADGTQTNYQLRVYCYYGAGTDTGFVLREPTSSSYAADAGTNTTTIVDAALTSTVDSYYIGAKVYNSTRSLWSVVTAYVAATKTLTISPDIAAQTTADLYYLYEIPPVMYFNGKCQADFDDLIFTRNDGTTTLDYWIESYTESLTAIVWVEFNTITLPPTMNTFWVYYGNAAATTASNGTNTFIAFDNFERGVDGDTIGGSWTEVNPDVHISTDHNYTIGGTRSGKWIGEAANAIATYPRVAGNNYAVSMRIWKEDATQGAYFAVHGNATKKTLNYINSTEDIYYQDDSGVHDTGYNITADAWQLLTHKNYTFASGYTFDIDANLVPVANDINMLTAADDVNVLDFLIVAAGVGNDYYIDDFRIRNFTVNEPRWSTFTAEVSLGATPVIQDVAVFKSYLQDNDWLFAIRYLNTYYPYYDSADIRQYFVFQLRNLAGTVVAQTPVLAWGNKPGSLYISPTLAASLEWGSAYTVRIYGLMSGNPTATWTLASGNWLGSDLTNLDSWVLSSTSVIESYYYVQPSSTTVTDGTTTTTTSGALSAPSATALINQDLTTFISGRGQVLNSTGGSIFETGIPGLSYVRPNLFQTYSIPGTSTATTFQQTYRQQLGAWQTNIGADGTVMLTRLGNLFGITGNIVMIIIMMVFLLIVAAVAFPMGHTTASLVLCILMLFSIVFWGLDPAWLVILTVVSGFLLFKQFIIDKGT